MKDGQLWVGPFFVISCPNPFLIIMRLAYKRRYYNTTVVAAPSLAVQT